ncbi:MAG TPA: YkgJ family cysteine cluster protein [Verrucomicrobiae bacterium]|nr:YkgJ family cysteine cluster protein [Verrucomicrobiae bacterium]
MKPARIDTPTNQNWSCHGCSDCCRGHLLVGISAEEKERIERQGWSVAEGVDPTMMVSGPMIVSGALGGHRLGHQADGACVFLDAAGRCRIHAKFGEAAKPLACRLYPLVIHPAGKKLLVGLRFSCPSAAKNLGRPLAEQAAEIPKLARLALPDDYEKFPPPPIASAVASTPLAESWEDFLRFGRWLDFTLAPADVPMSLKLLRSLHWLGAIEKGCLDGIGGPDAEEVIGALVKNAAERIPDVPGDSGKPSRFGQLFLRLLVLEHAQSPTVADRTLRSGYRWKLLAAALRFASPGGRTPALRAGLRSVKFSEIESAENGKAFGPLPPGAEALLTRYFRVKVQSLHFCGVAFHGRPLIEGFRNLALLYPVIVWLARWLAASDGRGQLSEADVIQAVTWVDYQYSYAPYLPWRTRLLQQRNDIVKLCTYYAC